MRDAQGRSVLADFGLGTRWNEAAARAIGPSGTPMYMAPELFSGSPASERSDVYSLGMVLWFALTGRHPHEVETLDELIAAARRGTGASLLENESKVPATLAAIVERAIAPDPQARFVSARRMVEALEQWRPAAAPRSRRIGRVAFIVVAALLGAATFAAWRGRRSADPAPAAVPHPATAPVEPYAVEASFLRRDQDRAVPLVTGDRVRPGDRLSLQVRATRRAWFYVLNEDDRGERYLLFPQPRFDLRNPLPAESTFVLPGTVGGRENAWTVTSAGGREYFLVVASPEPVREIEADLARLPAAQPGRPIDYAPVGEAAVERLRGVGGVDELPAATAPSTPRSRAFDRFKALAGRESGVRGVWVRQIVLENPR